MNLSTCANCSKPIIIEKGSWWTHAARDTDHDGHFCYPNHKGGVATPRGYVEHAVNHNFVGKREYGLYPGPDDKCIKCDVRFASHTNTASMVDDGQLNRLKGELLTLQVDHVKMATKVTIADLDKRAAEQHTGLFRDQASTLYDLKGWLRLCEDTPEGHAEFYGWACKLIFPDQYPEPSEEDGNGIEYPPSIQDGN